MLKLRDIMTTDVVTMSPELSLRDAMELLATRHVSGAPVVTGGRVLGVVSATDLLDFAATLPSSTTQRAGEPYEDPDESAEWEDAEDGSDPTAAYFTELWSNGSTEVEEHSLPLQRPGWNALEEHTVVEAMTANICALPSHARVSEAADYMRRAGIHRVLVMDHGRLSGIVSSMDITRAVAEHQLTSRMYVFNRARDFDERGWQPDTAD